MFWVFRRCNYRMSNIVAAIGLGQLEVLDERVARKREICAQYEARPVWKPMHLQPVFEGCRVRGGGREKG